MAHTHDHTDPHESDSEYEYRKSVVWGGFSAVVFILAVVFLLLYLLR